MILYGWLCLICRTDESVVSELDISRTENDMKLQHSLFSRLCPLLLIRLLPLKVFNDQKSSLVYGDLPGQNSKHLIRIIYGKLHEIKHPMHPASPKVKFSNKL